MGRVAQIRIMETVTELQYLIKRQKTLKAEKRLRALVLIKQNKFGTQQEIADHLGVTRRTLVNWLSQYRNDGLDGYLPKTSRNKPSKIITAEIHKSLEKKLHDANDPLLGYWHAKQWVWEQHSVEVQYHWLRKYMINHFKSKLKRARKSNIKKDEQAVEAFLKTA